LLIVQLLNALLVYLLAKHYTNDRFILVLSFLSYFLLSFHSDGCFFVLEPFVTFFGLASILFYLLIRRYSSYWMLVSGFLAALAFLNKQYGIVYLLSLPAFILIDNKDILSIIKRVLLYIVGYCLPFLVFILYLKIANGGLRELFTLYSGSGYGQRSLEAYLSGLYTLLKIYGIFLPFSLWVLFKTGIRNHIVVYLYLIGSFSLQFFFYKFPHYYLLLLPHLILCAVITYGNLFKEKKVLIIYILTLSITFIINIYSDIRTTLSFSGSHSVVKENFNTQSINALKIKKYLGHNDKVLLSDFDLAPYYFLSDMNPPLEKKYGIVSSEIVSRDKYLENVERTDFVLVWKKSLKNFLNQNYMINTNWMEIKISNDLILLKKDVN
jgi:hypothetical protein